MNRPSIQLQDLIGRQVTDANGHSAGRIEEIVARRVGSDYLVEEFHLGKRALIERLSVAGLSLTFLRFLGARRHPASNSARWEQMDLSDPLHPKLKGAREDLKKL
jgi:hypothetical protein